MRIEISSLGKSQNFGGLEPCFRPTEYIETDLNADVVIFMLCQHLANVKKWKVEPSKERINVTINK